MLIIKLNYVLKGSICKKGRQALSCLKTRMCCKQRKIGYWVRLEQGWFHAWAPCPCWENLSLWWGVLCLQGSCCARRHQSWLSMSWLVVFTLLVKHTHTFVHRHTHTCTCGHVHISNVCRLTYIFTWMYTPVFSLGLFQRALCHLRPLMCPLGLPQNQ